ncbi:hypothetical protein ABTX99_01805 [Streptomyces flaveolus]|uniref:hypothetical protein n=1 Tax=Streptomyces flaveolus TaxID=67297 RepID=UPI003322DA31
MSADVPSGRTEVRAAGSGAAAEQKPAGAERDELLGGRRFEEAAGVADLRTKPARAEEFAATLRERLEAWRPPLTGC